MVDPERLSAIIDGIYAAALDPEAWPAALEGVAGFVGGAAVMMFWQDSMLAKGGRYHSWGDDPEYTKSYFGEYIALNPIRKMQPLVPVGKVVSISGLIGAKQMREGRFYDEWMRPQGYVDNVLTNLDRSTSSYATFAVARHERHGLVDAQAVRRMNLLAPHLRRSVLIGKLSSFRRNEDEAWAELLEGIGAGIVLIDGRRRLVQANQTARAMIEEAEVIALVAERIECLDRHFSRDFRDFQEMVASGDERIGTAGMALPLRGKSGVDYIAHFLPMHGSSRRPAFDHPGAVAAIFFRRAEIDKRSGLPLLAQRFGLTLRELEVLQAIVEVRGVSQVAALLGISSRTAKAHLHSVFAKTGTDRQADLVKLLAGFAAPV